MFLQVWDNAQDLPRLQNDLAKKIAVVTRLVSWQSQDIDVIQRHYNNLKAGNFPQADTVESVIQDLRSTKRGVKISPSDWKSRNQTKQSPLDKD
ncbi:hypothetical protein [Coleofasciculus sp. E2-BRE-01]|uniref:hypothetical protein n=1 Tax=Coleofasciculus sp. E2-BRE-01 TaxID=3069524 RepID=UPI003302928B